MTGSSPREADGRRYSPEFPVDTAGGVGIRV